MSNVEHRTMLEDQMSLGRPLKVAYILLYFPRPTETFIADEINSIRKYNVDVQIISLLSAGTDVVQPVSRELLKFTSYAPGLLSLTIWKAQIYFLFSSFQLYFKLLITLLI